MVLLARQRVAAAARKIKTNQRLNGARSVFFGVIKTFNFTMRSYRSFLFSSSGAAAVRSRGSGWRHDSH